MFRSVLYVLVTMAASEQAVHAAMTFEVIRPDEPIFYDLGPKRLPGEIKDCANSPGRVFATLEDWSGGYSYRTVYFRGETATLNAQLEQLASFSGMPVLNGLPLVIIHDDERPRQVNTRRLFDVPEFDWRLHFNTHIQLDGPSQGKLDVAVYAEIWISDRIALDQLKIPQQLRTKAVSRVEKYADNHEASRLGSRQAVLEQRIREFQDQLAIERRRQAWEASTRPAQSQRHSAGVPTTNPTQ